MYAAICGAGAYDMHGSPGFRFAARRFEIRRHHADHGVTIAAQHDGLAYYTAVGSELPLPQGVAQHDDEWPPSSVVLFGDYSTQQRLRAQRAEEPSRHQTGDPLQRLAAARIIERLLRLAANLSERLDPGFDVGQVRNGLVRAESNQPLRLLIRQRPQ